MQCIWSFVVLDHVKKSFRCAFQCTYFVLETCGWILVYWIAVWLGLYYWIVHSKNNNTYSKDSTVIGLRMSYKNVSNNFIIAIVFLLSMSFLPKYWGILINYWSGKRSNITSTNDIFYTTYIDPRLNEYSHHRYRGTKIVAISQPVWCRVRSV